MTVHRLNIVLPIQTWFPFCYFRLLVHVFKFVFQYLGKVVGGHGPAIVANFTRFAQQSRTCSPNPHACYSRKK